MFPHKECKRDEDGKVITQPRNFYTRPLARGRVKSVYFDKAPVYVSIGDPFKEAMSAVMRYTVKDGHLKAGHDRAFKPAKIVQEKVKAPYEHTTELVDVKKHILDEDGKVITAPRNIVTNPPKSGTQYKRTCFSPIPAFMPDDFNYPRILATKEWKAGKLLLQDKPFSNRVRTPGVFNPGKLVFGEDIPIKPKTPKATTRPPMEQEAAFKPARPARSGFKCTFENFPVYMPNPLKFTTRIRPVEGEEQPIAFKNTT